MLQQNEEGTVHKNGKVRTILVVEDNPEVLKVINRVLDTYCFRVLVAQTAREAKKILLAADRPVHLLISDVVLPDGNGPALAKEFAEKFPGSAILLMTGWITSPIVDSLTEETQNSLLRKPFSPQTLLDRVVELINGTGTTAI